MAYLAVEPCTDTIVCADLCQVEAILPLDEAAHQRRNFIQINGNHFKNR